MRDTPGLPFFEEALIEDSPFPRGPGYYALSRHEDIWHVSRNAQLFCSSKGSNIGDLPQEMNEFFGSMINMDDPKHFRLRSIVSKGFTPKEVGRVEDNVRVKAAEIVDRLLEQFPDKQCDFVEHVAAALPLEIICDMMGIPAEDYSKIFKWTNTILGVGDPEFVGTLEDLMAQALEMFMYAQALGEDRRANPTDDITSVMMAADLDGDQLTAQEFGSFFILLVVAGNETTRNADQPRHEGVDRVPRPTGHPVRRLRGALEDGDGGDRPVGDPGHPLPPHRDRGHRPSAVRSMKAGDKVVMFYNSGNRDERVFEDPFTFDVTPPDAAGPDRLRCRRPALLPRRQPRPTGDDRDVRRDPPPPAVAADHRRARLPAERVHQRHQAHAVRLGLMRGVRHRVTNLPAEPRSW